MNKPIKPNPDNPKKKAEFYSDSCKMAAVAIRDISEPIALISGDYSHAVDLELLHDALKEQTSDVLDGDASKIEIMLMVQSKTLDMLFNAMISKSLEAKHIESVRYHMDIALRAQNQARKTLLALATIKNPPQKQIVGQQNIALSQQINNGVTLKSEHQKLKPENELICEAKYETLDNGGTLKTSAANQNTKTVAMVNRRKNATRQR